MFRHPRGIEGASRGLNRNAGDEIDIGCGIGLQED